MDKELTKRLIEPDEIIMYPLAHRSPWRGIGENMAQGLAEGLAKPFVEGAFVSTTFLPPVSRALPEAINEGSHD